MWGILGPDPVGLYCLHSSIDHKPMASFTTHHTYPDIAQGGRLVRTDWDTTSPETAIRATLRYNHDAVVLLLTTSGQAIARGLMPAGLGPALD
jgi:hypothetical protein